MLKYFAYIAQPYFRTAPSGERLFMSLDGFWTKPYIIPNAEIEKRLLRKLLWMWLIWFLFLIVGQQILLIAIPNLALEPTWTAIYVAALIFMIWLVNWLTFRKDLQQLKQFDKRISFRDFYQEEAKRQSIVGLILTFIVCVGLMIAGSWVMKQGFNPFAGWLGIIASGLGAALCAYMLYWKLTLPRTTDTETTIPKTEA